MTTNFFGGSAVLLGRSLRHITRSPDTIITTTIMPIAMLLLFVYVFGGAIKSGADSYVNYLLPGILLVTVACIRVHSDRMPAATSIGSHILASASSGSRGRKKA